MESCLYEGRVRHRRFEPVGHAFSYPLFLAYLDLDELGSVFAGRWFWSVGRANLSSFRREDHFGDPRLPLDRCVRDAVEEHTGRRPAGPIRLLTHLRYFGHCFNPVSFFYCFAPDGRAVAAVVAEVHNIPWRETHCYVVQQPGRAEHRLGKEFHVSPFMPMGQEYRWRLPEPGDRLAVHMENFEAGRKMFDATMCLQRRPISGANLARALVRFPAMTLQVVAAIYGQALLLYAKGAPFHPHPKFRERTSR